jgi:hypothetical protein
MLKSALYFILGISVILFTNSPVFATPVFAKFVVPLFHPHAIYWTALGLGILIILCVVCSPHRKD